MSSNPLKWKGKRRRRRKEKWWWNSKKRIESLFWNIFIINSSVINCKRIDLNYTNAEKFNWYCIALHCIEIEKITTKRNVFGCNSNHANRIHWHSLHKYNNILKISIRISSILLCSLSIADMRKKKPCR